MIGKQNAELVNKFEALIYRKLVNGKYINTMLKNQT